MVTIENEYLKVDIALKEGVLSSIYDKKNDKEILWQGGEPWNAKDHMIFPFVGRLVDGFYTHNGKRYEMGTHGFARNSNFDIISQNDTTVILGLKYNEQTLAVYPYKFEFSVKYELIKNKIQLTYTTKNTDNVIMPFAFGSHPGIAVPFVNGDTLGTSIEFGEIKNINNYSIKNNFILRNESFGKMDRIELTKGFFKENSTLIIDYDNKPFILKKGDGQSIRFASTSPYLALWSDENAGGYVCVESWWGLPDEYDVIREMNDKNYLIKLKPNDTYIGSYYMEIL